MQIAFVEDDPDQAEMLSLWLETAGHDANWFVTGRAFMESVRTRAYDLLLVDWVLPDVQGDEIVRWVRENFGWDIPVLITTTRGKEEDIVAGLNAGADDYLVKPLKQFELVARIDTVGRRVKARRQPVIQAGDYEIDSERQQIRLAGKSIELTQKELDLAYYLFTNPGKLFSRHHLLDKIWGVSADVDTRTVDTHVSRLRRKLALSEENGWKLSPVYGYGYRMERCDSPPESPPKHEGDDGDAAGASSRA